MIVNLLSRCDNLSLDLRNPDEKRRHGNCCLEANGNPILLTPGTATLEYGHSRGPVMASGGGNPRAWMDLLTVGVVLVTCIVLGYLAGDYVDARMATGPWGVVTGVMAGTGAGFLNLFRTVARNQK